MITMSPSPPIPQKIQSASYLNKYTTILSSSHTTCCTPSTYPYPIACLLIFSTLTFLIHQSNTSSSLSHS